MTSRAARITATLIALLATLTIIGLTTHLVTIYNAPGNAGVVVGVPCHNIGYEWRGTPGPFTDSCD